MRHAYIFTQRDAEEKARQPEKKLGKIAHTYTYMHKKLLHS
jgi:hypothetical protein